VRSSVFAGLAVAEKVGSQALAGAVRGAFVSGMDAALWVSVGFACVGGALALAFLPNRNAAREAAETASEVVVRERPVVSK
jgi:DHA2 family multidrug resistance protein-like MFS transporter